MKIIENLPKFAIVALLVGGVAIIGSKAFMGSSGALIVDVKVPELTKLAQRGKQSFDANCVSCHGDNASGSELGPPLVHDIYNPGHHADQAFYFAAQRGVKRHHWPFGDMPAQPQIRKSQVRDIIHYVRELQIANGILTKQHTM